MSCKNDTDKLSVSNYNAKLEYPIGFTNSLELNLIGNSDSIKTLSNYWTLSPVIVNNAGVYNNAVNISGTYSWSSLTSKYGVRPVISLAYGALVLNGDGTMEKPYVIK